jgi:hypothetical protein
MGGFNPEEKNEHIALIHFNIYESVQNIFKASAILDISLSPEWDELDETIRASYSQLITPQLAKSIYIFWKHDTVQRIFSRKAEFQIGDNTAYYMANILRICATDYVPNELDILNSRCKTTGITETPFMFHGKKFLMVDVGGQRSERKKWIHCFEEVFGVLFCVGISAFDQTLEEDNATPRLKEDLSLFHDICVSKWFTTTAVILFLNKADLFKEKLAQGKSISLSFPEFKEGTNYKASINFLKEKFMNVTDPLTKRRKDIFCHITTATDTENVRFVFDDVREYIMNSVFQSVGL